MWYINKYRGNYDEVYYFNANVIIDMDIPLCGDRMLVTRHTHKNDNLMDGHSFLNINDDDPNSLSYIGFQNYTYIQAGFFGGKSEVVYQMCKDVSDWVESDLMRRIIPKWHDESYLNKWRVINSHLCEIINVWEYIYLGYNEKFIPKK